MGPNERAAATGDALRSSIRTWRCAPVEQDAFRQSFAVQQREGLGALAELSSPDNSFEDELAALLAGGHDHEVGPRFLRAGAVDFVRDHGDFRAGNSYRNPPVVPPR